VHSPWLESGSSPCLSSQRAADGVAAVTAAVAAAAAEVTAAIKSSNNMSNNKWNESWPNFAACFSCCTRRTSHTNKSSAWASAYINQKFTLCIGLRHPVLEVFAKNFALCMYVCVVHPPFWSFQLFFSWCIVRLCLVKTFICFSPYLVLLHTSFLNCFAN